MTLRIAIDGTVTSSPAFFSAMTTALRAAGHKVFIISYRADRGFAKEDLAEHKISYDGSHRRHRPTHSGIPIL